MSYRHTLITQFLYTRGEDQTDIVDFVKALKGAFSSGFAQVYPHYDDYGTLTFVAIYAKDGGGYEVQHELPDLLKEAAGILKQTVDVIAAWEFDDKEPRPRVFEIEGRGQLSRLDWLDKNS